MARVLQTLLLALLLAHVSANPDANKNDKESTFGGRICTFTTSGGAFVGGVAIPLTVKGILGVLGFSSSGVVSGSLAAGAQATIGNVAAGSAFAGLQSLGAAGVAFTGPVGIAGVVLGGAVGYWYCS